MLMRQLFDAGSSTYTYLIAQNHKALLIDPVLEQVERDCQLLTELDLELIYCLETHVHADHITGAAMLRERTGAQCGVAAVAEAEGVDLALVDGDQISLDTLSLDVRATPGHTDSCLTFVLSDDDQMMAFTGDALLIRKCGRTDFQQGDPRQLYRSVHQQIFSLPDHTLIYPAHDYCGLSVSSVLEEKKYNQRLNLAIDEAQFVDIMNNLHLPDPKKIKFAVPANLCCGASSS